MWLINIETYKLCEFVDPPPYAILSHTWGEEEVSFRDMENLTKAKTKCRGWAKIEKSCSQARHRGLHYVWVDTCCIDKSSSAELTEAINSMYRWYQESSVCFA